MAPDLRDHGSDNIICELVMQNILDSTLACSLKTLAAADYLTSHNQRIQGVPIKQSQKTQAFCRRFCDAI